MKLPTKKKKAGEYFYLLQGRSKEPSKICLFSSISVCSNLWSLELNAALNIDDIEKSCLKFVYTTIINLSVYYLFFEF